VADLVISDLVVEYTRAGYSVRPIDGLSVTVPAGSLALLLGPSGCGKTTLLSCLASILRPTSGTITYGDTEISSLTGAALTQFRQRGVGVVFQAFNLVASMSALENVATPLSTAKVPWRSAKAKAAELLGRVGLSERTHHKPGNLSGGQQQRVAIARALALEPPLVLADEPTAHLDYVQVEGILRIIRSLTDGGRVVVVATHDERMLPLADQVIELVPRFMEGAERDPVAVELAAGETLFVQGSLGDVVYVVEQGEVELLRDGPDGTETPVAIVGAGEHFGEMGPLFGLPRSATARARTACVLTAYTVKAFRERFGLRHLGDLIGGGDDGALGR
jgi:putative ABC transport system ATP-binding protein